MNRKIQLRQTEFLQQLFKRIDCYQDLVAFLVSEGVVKQLYLKEKIQMKEHRAHVIQELLRSENDAVQMVTYEWTLLPRERMVLYIVTNNNARDFVYEE